MNYTELEQSRRARWRIAGGQSPGQAPSEAARPGAVRTLEDARDFIESCGLCLMFPERSLLLPTLLGACAGTDEKLPAAKQAYADPRVLEARVLALRLARERFAYRWPMPTGDNELLISAAAFPFFYALAADMEGSQQPAWATGEPLSQLVQDAWTAVRRERKALSQSRLRDILGAVISPAALERGLHQLWARLRIVPVDYSEREGTVWQSVYRWAPAIMSEAAEFSHAAALAALLSQYVEAAVAVEQVEVEATFSFLASRSRVREALNALLAARELSVTQVGRLTMLQVTPARVEFSPRRARTPAEVPDGDRGGEKAK